MCGVTIARGCVRSGCSSGSGSGSVTSSATADRRSSSSAFVTASRSTRPPREVLTRIGRRSMAASVSAPMMWRVSSVSGAWRETASAPDTASSTLAALSSAYGS
jgi:hypothetical protein